MISGDDTPALQRSDGLDALRALLALWVMLAHLLLWSFVITGNKVPILHGIFDEAYNILQKSDGTYLPTHPAVIAFIVLSGYCIHRSGLGIGISNYFWRRFFRIYPLYILAVGAGLLSWHNAMDINPEMAPRLTGTSEIDPICVAQRLLALQALFPSMAQGACRFIGNGPINTVMVEITLYATYPLLWLMIGQRHSKKLMWGLISVVWSIGTVIVTFYAELRWWWNNASLLGFLPYWWIGVAALHSSFANRLRRHAKYIWIAFVITIIGATLASPPVLVVEIRKILLALATVLVILHLDRPHIRAPLLAPIGRAGYSIYAFHAPALHTMLLYGLPWWFSGVGAIGIGMISYQLVEKPMIRAGAKWVSRHERTRHS